MAVLLDHTLLETHDRESGKYDALRVADSLSLSTTEMASLLGCTARGLRKNPTSSRIQETLTELVGLLALLRELLDDSMPYVRIWLRSPHPDLAGRTPLSYLLERRIDVVRNLADSIATGQTG